VVVEHPPRALGAITAADILDDGRVPVFGEVMAVSLHPNAAGLHAAVAAVVATVRSPLDQRRQIRRVTHRQIDIGGEPYAIAHRHHHTAEHAHAGGGAGFSAFDHQGSYSCAVSPAS